MSSASPDGDLDSREASVATELDMLTSLAGMGIKSGSISHVNGSLVALQALRPDAKSLADAGRPAQSARLEAMIEDLGNAMATMGKAATELPLMFRKADMADTVAQGEARAEREDVWKETLDEASESRQDRAEDRGDLL